MFITRIKTRLNLNTTRLIRAKPVSLWSDFHSGGIHPIFLCVIVFLHRIFCGPNRGQPADQVRGHASPENAQGLTAMSEEQPVPTPEEAEEGKYILVAS
jgi:hypothetical protein